MATEKEVRGLANLARSVVIPQNVIPSLRQGLAEYDPDNPDHDLMFAELVHIIAGVDISVGDVTIGAVELKDSESDTHVSILPKTVNNAIATVLVDSEGNEVSPSNLSSLSETTVGSPVSETVTQLGGMGTDEIPTLADEGDAVRLWVNTRGQLVIAGYDKNKDAVRVSSVDEGLFSSIGPVNNLTNISEEREGSSVKVTGHHNITVQLYGTNTAKMTVVVEHSLNNTDWVPVKTIAFTEDMNEEVTFSNVRYEYVRTNITSHISGSVTTIIAAGN